jgi:hypothetical protein
MLWHVPKKNNGFLLHRIFDQFYLYNSNLWGPHSQKTYYWFKNQVLYHDFPNDISALWLRYGRDDRGTGVRLPAGLSLFSFHEVHRYTEMHQASCPVRTAASLRGRDAVPNSCLHLAPRLKMRFAEHAVRLRVVHN